eukprot:gene4644-6344_t
MMMPCKSITLALILSLAALSPAASFAQNAPAAAAPASIDVGTGAVMVPPEGWTVSRAGAIVRYTPPENNVVIAVLPIAAAKSGEDAAAQAWQVFKRYILNAPTAWIFDASNMLYGSLFMLCGAYTLAQNGHVRGDFLYSSMKPRTQAGLDLALYILFFLPGICALVYAGYSYAGDSWRIGEHSNVTADGPPVYHFKTVIPVAGALVLLQGMAEIIRCIVCLKTGAWPARSTGSSCRNCSAARRSRSTT